MIADVWSFFGHDRLLPFGKIYSPHGKATLIYFHKRTFPDPTADDDTAARNPRGLLNKTDSSIVNSTVTKSFPMRRIPPPLIWDNDRRHLDFLRGREK